ncbi:hypothetical protein ACQ9LF_04750 [Anaerohalosphaeraceae bacterium U12dextr]
MATIKQIEANRRNAHSLTPSDYATPDLATALCHGGIGQALLGRGILIKWLPFPAASPILEFLCS